jgi:methionyl-tRNA formyltransferase
MEQEKLLFLGPEDSPLITWLQEQGEQVIQTADRISPQFITEANFTFLVSYGYSHILRKDILDKFPKKAINLHISYLPWNRGDDPNFWSFVEDTPKGVTIHYLDEGVDTGDIIIQKKLKFDSETETLVTSYNKLQEAIQEIFRQNWNDIKNGICQRQKQVGRGSTHKVKDMEGFSHLLEDGWNTPISVLEECASEMQMSQQFWDKYDSEIEEIRNQNKE